MESRDKAERTGEGRILDFREVSLSKSAGEIVETQEKSQISSLPEELVIKIFSYLSPYEHHQSTSLVCKLWHRLVTSVLIQTNKYFSDAIRKGDIFYNLISLTNLQVNKNSTPRQGRLRMRPFEPSVNHPKNRTTQIVIPSPRFSHSSCVMGKYMYIFGGSSTSNSAYNDLHRLDLITKKWERLIIREGAMPSPRECCCITPYKGSIVLFGGWCQPRRTDVAIVPRFFNDVHIINIALLKCNKIADSNPWPCERAGHNVCVVKDSLVVFGGAQRNQRYHIVKNMSFSMIAMFAMFS